MNTRLSLAVVTTAVLLAGCAARVDYSTQVLRLEQAISDSAGSIESIDAAVTERQNALLKQRIIDGTLLLDTADEQCGVGRKGCSLVVLEAKEGRASVLSEYPVRSVMPKGREALRMVKRYVGGLKSIVEAETASKVSASANATLGSLEEIADRLARETGGAPAREPASASTGRRWQASSNGLPRNTSGASRPRPWQRPRATRMRLSKR